jgi:predicted transcriptional regulator
VAREVDERGSLYRLSEEERAAVRAGMDDARRADFASEEEIEAFYQLHRNDGLENPEAG